MKPRPKTLRPLMLVVVWMSLAVAAIAEPATTRPAEKEANWSEESNGLRARLSMRRGHVVNGTGIVVTYLELSNVSDLGTPMLVIVRSGSVKFSVTDADGRDVPQANGPFSGRVFDVPELVLPHDSSIRFRIGPRGFGIPADQAALVDLGPMQGWVLPRDGKAYYLQGVLEVAKVKDDRTERGTLWHGKVELPRVRIPTEPEPTDPATLGPRIDELGAKMLDKDSRESEAAVRELSLIDDPRVIPWYVQAMQTRSYSLKFNALDRLSRLEGEGALEGLKIGMTTQGEDIGNTTAPAVANQSAEGIRHSAALALSRSPHPKAKTLLFTMEDDPDTAVRITVVQTAARMDTPESLALLKRRTHDPAGSVRGEAERLLKLRLGEGAK
jgi:hypothetical protein